MCVCVFRPLGVLPVNAALEFLNPPCAGIFVENAATFSKEDKDHYATRPGVGLRVHHGVWGLRLGPTRALLGSRAPIQALGVWEFGVRNPKPGQGRMGKPVAQIQEQKDSDRSAQGFSSYYPD